MGASDLPAEEVPRGPRVGYVIGTYPSLTTTFIDREIRTLRGLGAEIRVVAVRRPTGLLSDEQRELQRDVRYLLPASLRLLIAAQLWCLLTRPRAYLGLLALIGRPHPRLKARLMTLLHLGEGVYAAYMLRGERCDQLHAHFIDRAATIALAASRLLGVPYSVTAHANDIYVDPVLVPEKLGGAAFIATCTAYNQAYLQLLAPRDAAKIVCLYHGLETERYRPVRPAQAGRPLVVAVGQLKEKKGFGVLLQACRRLHDQGLGFECRIVGAGPQHALLQAQIFALGLTDTVRLVGAMPHAAVIDLFRAASLFVLPCVVSANGDRDGIPNALLEAMAMRLAVVSTTASGIPEVVQHSRNGWLVPPADDAALADAMTTLLCDPELRDALGRRARETVLERFDAAQNVRRLLTELGTVARDPRQPGAVPVLKEL